MNYEQSIEYINRITQEKGICMGLNTMRQLLASFDYPERKYKIIHIAGTNGKGSVSAFLAFILREAGYKVGRYISPILRDYCEKIQFLEKENEYYITKEEVALYMSEIKQNVGTLSPSPFELETLMAMLSFRDHKCDYVILECGMGGIEDATNAISRKEMCIFTSISYDHMSYLGNTLEKIADNKLGILQNNVPIVCGWQEESIRKRIQSVAKQMNAPITICSNPIITSSSISYTQFSYKDRDWTIPLIGEYQPNNAVVAIEAAYILLASIEELARISIIQRGLGKAIWPGRFQILSDCPYIILDGAHNEAGVQALVRSLDMLFPKNQFMRIGIMGTFKDKDIESMAVKMKHAFAEVHTVTAPTERGMNATKLADILERILSQKIYPHQDIPLEAVVDKNINRCTKVPLVIIIFGSLSLSKKLDRYL